MTKAIVWSKDGCGHCVQAKALLESMNIDIEERNITGGIWTREQLFDAVPHAKTMPQIFLGEEYIGSYKELKERLNK